MTNVVQEYIVGDGIYDKVTHHSDTHYICSSKVSNGSTNTIYKKSDVITNYHPMDEKIEGKLYLHTVHFY